MNNIYKIIIPKEEPKSLTKLEIAKNIAAIGIGIGKKEEPKQETLEEAFSNYVNEKYHFPIQGSIPDLESAKFGAKWQQERMYSEENLYSEIESLIIMWSNDGTKTAGALTRQIMEQFKKK
jgi:hypothetical protein